MNVMQDKKTTTAIILNPMARDWEARKKWPVLERILVSYSINFEKFETSPNMDVVLAVKEIAEAGFGRIVGAGGDGTQNAVVNGIMRADVEIRPEYAVFPFGTANNIGKSFNIEVNNWAKKDLESCVRALVAGTRYNLDLGLVNGDRYFADSFTLGFDAVVLKDRNATRHKRIIMNKGVESYVPSLFKSFLGQYKRPTLSMIVDGVKFEDSKLFNFVMKCVQVYAGNFILSENIRGNDGILDAFLYTNAEAYTSEIGTHVLKKMLQIDPTGISTDLVDLAVQNSEHLRGRSYEIRLSAKTPSQIDGEEYHEGKEFKIECAKHALTLIVPYER